MKPVNITPLNWLNAVLIAVIVLAGVIVSAREDVTASDMGVQPLPADQAMVSARL